jgi:multicomponent Na+:H+ antiporter subunit D
MNGLAAQLPALLIVLPLMAAAAVALVRSDRLAFVITVAVSAVLPVMAAVLLHRALVDGPISYAMGGWPPPWGIEYRVDVLSGFVLTLVSAVAAVSTPYARRSLAAELGDGHSAFYALYLLCLAGLLGVTITGDAFNAFVFLEISSLATYALIAMGKDRRAPLAAFQYLIVGTIGATFYVIGVGFLYLLTGTLNLVDMAQRLAALPVEQTRAVVTAMAFIAVGVSLKLALFPLHFWLPNAYAFAPSWGAAFLSATATKVAVYLLVRFFFSVFGMDVVFDRVLVALSIAGMFIASVIAIYETNIKRMMAYSSVAQIGYITLGIGLSTTAGLTGSLVHLLNHAVTKGTLFLALGAVALRLGSVKLGDLAGLGRRMPLTMGAFAVAALGIVGAPGTAGFISKWYLIVGALEAGEPAIAFLIVASSVISVIYVGRVLEAAWFRAPSPLALQAKDPPLSMLAPIVIFAAASVYLGVDTRFSAGIASIAAEQLLGGLR